MNEFIQQYNTMEEALEQLDMVSELLRNALHEGIINPTTHLRTMAGVNQLKMDLIYNNNHIDDDYYIISLESIEKILSTSKAIELDPANFPISFWIHDEVEIVRKFLKEIYATNQKQITQESADKLLSAIRELDNYIDK